MRRWIGAQPFQYSSGVCNKVVSTSQITNILQISAINRIHRRHKYYGKNEEGHFRGIR